MTDDQQLRVLEQLPERLAAAVNSMQADAPQDPPRSEAIERVKVRAKMLAHPPVTRTPESTPRRGFTLFARRGVGLAATVLFVLGGLTALLMPSNTAAFAEVLQKVKAAETVQFRTLQRIGQQPEQIGKIFLNGTQMRVEHLQGQSVFVLDRGSKKAMHFDHRNKRAEPVPLISKLISETVNPVDQLRQVAAGDVSSLGEETIDGRATRVYRAAKVNILGIDSASEMLVWVDVKRELPAKIVIRDADPKHPLELRFDEFVWNQALDAELFALDVPAGYELLKPAAIPTINERPVADANAPAFENGLLLDRVPRRIAWQPSGDRLTAIMQDPESSRTRQNQLRQWDVKTGKLIWSQTIAGSADFAQTVNGQRLANVVGYEVQLRDAATGTITTTWATKERLSPLAFSPDGTILAAGITEWGKFGGRGGKEAGGVEFWDIATGQLIRSLTDDQPTTFLAYSPNGKYVAASPNMGPVKVWEAATGQLVRILPAISRGCFSGDSETFACIVFSQTEKVFAVDLYRIADGIRLRTITNPGDPKTSILQHLECSPDGRLLSGSDWNGTVTVWNFATGAQVDTFREGDGIHAAIFSPDSKTLAVGCENKSLWLKALP